MSAKKNIDCQSKKVGRESELSVVCFFHPTMRCRDILEDITYIAMELEASLSIVWAEMARHEHKCTNSLRSSRADDTEVVVFG